MIYTIAEMQELILRNPSQWRPLVFTNGCFDIIHVGHVQYLKTAKKMGRSLIIGLNSDQSVQKIKPKKSGLPPRPIIPESQRAEVLSALKPVDGVIIFHQTTADELILALKPDIYVKGGDYTIETLPETPTINSYGGKIELVKVEILSSTTGIINHILQYARDN